jgi:SAM-dependent methyltransferase
MCQREHPIIDGIPVVVADIGNWAAHQLDAVMRRDFSTFMESLLGDAAGPETNFNNERTNLSGYARGHWGDLDEERPAAREGSFVKLLETALTLLGEAPRGIWIDLGCSVGRGTFELARRTGNLVVGVDLNFAMLRVAEKVRRQGRAVFPLRRVGIVFDRCDFPVPNLPRQHVSFWCCDVAALPFDNGIFDGALSLNVLDSIQSPLGHLMEMGRVLAAGARALLSSPYDWSPTATPLAHWLGGHSQRTASGGSSVAELRRILSIDAAAGVDTGLLITGERDRVPWRVYANERASMDYAVHLLSLQRKS